MSVNSASLLIASIAGAASAAANAISTPVLTGDRFGGNERINAGKRAQLRVARGQGGGASDTVGTIAVWGADLTNPLTGNPLGNAFASPAASPTVQAFVADGTVATFQSNIPYAAFSNYNWMALTRGRKFAGTVAVAAGAVAMVGTSTAFLTELSVGDVIVAGGQNFTVLSVTDDTHATLVNAAGAAISGATAYNLTLSKRMKTRKASPSANTEFDITNVGGFALLTFGVAPFGGATPNPAGAQGLDVVLWQPTPVQVLADGAHVRELVGIRSYSTLWVQSTVASGAISATDVFLEHAVG